MDHTDGIGQGPSPVYTTGDGLDTKTGDGLDTKTGDGLDTKTEMVYRISSYIYIYMTGGGLRIILMA